MSEIASIRQTLMRARAFLELYDRGVIEILPEKAPVIERCDATPIVSRKRCGNAPGRY
jgi:hypothetical protein